MISTVITATTTYQKLSDLLVAAGITGVSSDSVTSDTAYLLNRSSSINILVGAGFGAIPTGTQSTVTPLAAILINKGQNTNDIWIKSASSTASVEFVEGASAYENPSITGVIGTITLTNNTVPKGSSNNLVNSSIVDDGTTVAVSEPLTSTGYIKSSGLTGIGYAVGSGNAATQATNKSTTVAFNAACGAITMNAAQLNAGVIVSFTFTNTSIAATDVLVLNHISGGTVGSYTLNAQCGAGSAVINVRNNTAGNLSEAIVIQFALIKGVNT